LDTNENSSEISHKKFLPYIGGAAAIIVILVLFVAGNPTSPKDIAEKYAQIQVEALNNGTFSDNDLKWFNDVFKYGVTASREIGGLRQTASTNKQLLALQGTTVKAKLKKIYVVEEYDANCVVSVTLEITAFHPTETLTEDEQIIIYFVKDNDWKIERIEKR